MNKSEKSLKMNSLTFFSLHKCLCLIEGEADLAGTFITILNIFSKQFSNLNICSSVSLQCSDSL